MLAALEAQLPAEAGGPLTAVKGVHARGCHVSGGTNVVVPVGGGEAL